MKKMLLILFAAVLIPMTAAAASYNIDERTDETLAGIKTIVFDLRQPNCAICVSTGNQSYSVSGGGTPGEINLSLEGDLKSNNKKAVPSLITEVNGNVLNVRLYKENNLFFGLVQSGFVHFSAVLPEYFDGEIDVRTSSGDTALTALNAKIIKVKSNSGDVDVLELEAEEIETKASSGDITAGSIAAIGTIYMKASSGDISIDEALSEKADISASSGRIAVGRLRTTENLRIHASSGRINAEELEGRTISVDASSGRINIEQMTAEDVNVEASSGDITVLHLTAEYADFDASSGKTMVSFTALNGDLNVKSSSGDVSIELPSGTAFSADLKASSGKIRSDFRLLTDVSGDRKNEIRGDANGGGHVLRVKASSGDITIFEK